MRVAPLGARYPGDLEHAARQAALSAEVTHTHPEAVAGAVAVAVAASRAAHHRTEPETGTDLLAIVLDLAPPSRVRDGIVEARTLLDQPHVELAAHHLGNGRQARPSILSPFDSDLAADFVDELEGLTHQQVIDVLGRAFQRVTDSGERVDGGDGAEAVAAGALVASALPDSLIVIDLDNGPRKPLPKLPASLRASARLALDRVLQDGSKMATGWVDSPDADQWRQEVRQILQALETPTDH